MIDMLEKIIYNSKKSQYSTLIMGFGLGGAPMYLSKYNQITKIDTIDLDYDLFKIFKKVTKSHNINVSDKINFIHGNAIDYLKQSKINGTKYDFILDDIFDSAEKVDYDLDLIYDCLNEDGIFFMNVHYRPQDYVDILNEKGKYKNVGYIKNNEYLIYAQRKF